MQAVTMQDFHLHPNSRRSRSKQVRGIKNPKSEYRNPKQLKFKIQKQQTKKNI
jgi:hypothetical protein